MVKREKGQMVKLYQCWKRIKGRTKQNKKRVSPIRVGTQVERSGSIKWRLDCGPALFNVRPHSNGQDSLFVLLENHLKNGLESPLIFVLF